MQNYDGDDWGADDDFDDGEDHTNDDGSVAAEAGASGPQQPPPPMPPSSGRPGKLTAGLRAISQGSIPSSAHSGSAGSSPSLRPSERIAMEKQAHGQRSVTGPPALHIQTQGVQPPPPAQQATGEKSTASSHMSNPQFPPRKSSMKSQDRPDLTIDPVLHPPRTSSRSVSPASASAVRSPVSATGSTAPKFVRPSDIYRRAEEDKKEKEQKSLDSAQPSVDGIDEQVDSAERQSRRPSFGRNDSGGEGVRNLQPLAPVAERKSEYGFDGLTIQPGAKSLEQESKAAGEIEPDAAKEPNVQAVPETRPEPELMPEPEPSISQQAPPPILEAPQPTTAHEATPQPPPKRFSTSPKLPDFARMSGFGSDFFSSAGGLLGGSSKPVDSPQQSRGIENDPATSSQQHIEEASTAPKQPKPFRPSLPGGWVSETASTPGEMATPFGRSASHAQPEDISLKPAPLRTPTPRSSIVHLHDDDRASLQSSHGSPGMPPPLRTTPSPSKLSLVERPAKPQDNEANEREFSSDAAHTSDANTVAPAPLQPRKSPMPDGPAEDFRQSIQRLNTDSSLDNSSPLKESDVLRDEIIRSLSPVRSADSFLGATKDESAARESAYLNDVYGDYWSPEDSTTVATEKHIPPPGGAESPAALTQEPNEGPVASVAQNPPANRGTTPSLPAENIDETRVAAAGAGNQDTESNKPALKRERFSWEQAPPGSTPPNASPSPTKPVHALPPLPPEATQSAGVDEPKSPADSDRLSPSIALPALHFADEDEETEESKQQDTLRGVSAVGSHPPGSDTAMDPPSPKSPNHDRDSRERVEGENRLLSPSEEKIVLAGPTLSQSTPGSPSAVHEHPVGDRAESPIPTPTHIPLPRSPSPDKGITAASQEAFLPMEEKNMMTLHQMMQLPTSPERVYKMLETRAEFAATPSGLGQWLQQMLAQPEHTLGGPFFRYPPSGADTELLGAWARKNNNDNLAHGGGHGGGDGVGAQPELTSSSVGTGLSSGGSVRIAREANLQLGNLMHGTGQAGAKGKELLHSAGKMGKGLLSKGKNKLRERAESKRGM